MLRDAGARFVTLFLADSPEPALIGGVRAARRPGRPPGTDQGAEPARPTARWPAFWPAARWAEQELVERTASARSDLVSDPRADRPDADRLRAPPAWTRRVRDPLRPGPLGDLRGDPVSDRDRRRGRARGCRPARSSSTAGWRHAFAGLAPERAVHVAERVAGIATRRVRARVLSGGRARARRRRRRPRAERWRAVHAELERLACHFDVIAKEAETTALYVGQARFQILKERVTAPAGAPDRQPLRPRSRGPRRRSLRAGSRSRRAVRRADTLERELLRDRRLFLGTAVDDRSADRLRTCSPRELVEEYGAVGPVARGSGVSTDARHERPYGDYRRLGLRVVTQREGDAMARVNVRFDELV